MRPEKRAISHTCGGVRYAAAHLRHCERSEAIHLAACGGMDCFVASAPRNDVEVIPPHEIVITAKAGIQYAAACRFNHCCLWNTGSPAYAGDDTECAFAFSRRTAPEACSKLPSFEIGGSRECRVHAAPAVSCA